MTKHHFDVGDLVMKKSGDYNIPGRIIMEGPKVDHGNDVRYVVEHPGGFLHVYSASNLELLTAAELCTYFKRHDQTISRYRKELGVQ